MAIEITRNGTYIYRLNPINRRIIDRRLNRHRARWERYRSYQTQAEALAALLKIEKEQSN